MFLLDKEVIKRYCEEILSVKIAFITPKVIQFGVEHDFASGDLIIYEQKLNRIFLVDNMNFNWSLNRGIGEAAVNASFEVGEVLGNQPNLGIVTNTSGYKMNAVLNTDNQRALFAQHANGLFFDSAKIEGSLTLGTEVVTIGGIIKGYEVILAN